MKKVECCKVNEKYFEVNTAVEITLRPNTVFDMVPNLPDVKVSGIIKEITDNSIKLYTPSYGIYTIVLFTRIHDIVELKEVPADRFVVVDKIKEDVNHTHGIKNAFWSGNKVKISWKQPYLECEEVGIIETIWDTHLTLRINEDKYRLIFKNQIVKIESIETKEGENK